MTWLTFFAAREDLLDIARFVYSETDCRILEAYSAFDQPARQFTSIEALATVPELGRLPWHLALWSPAVGPPPVTQRIQLAPGAVPNHTHRFVTEGCSLITLQTGAAGNGILTASHLGWWTEASALRKAMPGLAPDTVAWPALARLARRIRYHISRRLRDATAAKRPVLVHAHALARDGMHLRDSRQPRADLTLDAA